MISRLSHIFSLLVVSVAIVTQAPPRQPAVTPLLAANSERLLVLHHEFLVPTPELPDAVNGRLVDFAVGSSGQIYSVDAAARKIRMFDSAGRAVAASETPPTADGLGGQPRNVTVGRTGDVYVLERVADYLHVFSPNLATVHTVPIETVGLRIRRGIEFVDDRTVVVSGISALPPFLGYGLHRFTLVSEDNDTPTFRYRGSFAQLLERDPTIYGEIAGGYLNRDVDGGLLFNQIAPYSLRKYTPDGELVWHVEDLELIPEPTTFFKVSEQGRILVTYYPVSLTLLPLELGNYLHIFLRPPTKFIGTREPYPEGVHDDYLAEIISVKNGDITRVRARLPVPLHYLSHDGQGRLIGVLGETSPQYVRSKTAQGTETGSRWPDKE